MPSYEGSLTNGSDDVVREAREVCEELGPLGLQPLHVRAIFVETAGALVEPARLEDVGVVDAWNRRGDEIPEVGISLPPDGAFGDSLHDRGRVRDAHLLRALLLVRPADATRVQQVHLERMLLEQLEEAVALEVVRHRKERVRSRNAQRLACILRTACGGTLR